MSTTRETIPSFIIEELRTVRSIARITGLKYSCGKISSPLTAGWKNRDLGSSFRPQVSGEPQLLKSALQIGNFWIPKELGIFWNCWNLYRVDVPHVKHGRWTKCYRFSCSQPALLMAHALLTIVTEESWILERIRIRVERQIRFQYVTCGREISLIRRKNKKYPDTCGRGLNLVIN